MTISELVAATSQRVNDRKVFISPNIPPDKLGNAIGSYARGISTQDVLVLVDDTVWGGAKEGMIVTKDKVFFKELAASPFSVSLEEIDGIRLKGNDFHFGSELRMSFNMPAKEALGHVFALLQGLINLQVESNLTEAELGERRLLESIPACGFEHIPRVYKLLDYRSGTVLNGEAKSAKHQSDREFTHAVYSSLAGMLRVATQAVDKIQTGTRFCDAFKKKVMNDYSLLEITTLFLFKFELRAKIRLLEFIHSDGFNTNDGRMLASSAGKGIDVLGDILLKELLEPLAKGFPGVDLAPLIRGRHEGYREVSGFSEHSLECSEQVEKLASLLSLNAMCLKEISGLQALSNTGNKKTLNIVSEVYGRSVGLALYASRPEVDEVLNSLLDQTLFKGAWRLK